MLYRRYRNKMRDGHAKLRKPAVQRAGTGSPTPPPRLSARFPKMLYPPNPMIPKELGIG